eukprot:TRINITY_DN10077_c0_g2_i1.p1 TRINITY_DN10077_c0_g2~~TRINITY_DN10077_c0_g2_i1.p1  ORF type:complete len:479 (+),score=84.32 TRINITY_DN10077_c0_g2_i1:66-1502(+)
MIIRGFCGNAEGNRRFGAHFLNRIKFNFEKFVLSRQPKIKHDLSQIDFKLFFDFNGGGETRTHFKSISNFLHSIYPFFHSDNQIGKKFLEDTNIKFYLENLSALQPDHLLQVHADWLTLTNETLIEHDGRTLLQNYNLLELFKSCFPEFFWERIWRFPTTAHSERKRIFIDQIVLSSFQFVCRQEDVMEVDIRSFLNHPRGVSILATYENTFNKVFEETYGELKWEYTNYCGYWEKRTSIDRFLLMISFVRTRLDFHSLTSKVILRLPGGTGLMRMRNGSIQSVCNDTYPELAVRRKRMHGYWNNIKKIDKIQHMVKMYNIKECEDWYRVSVIQISKVFGRIVTTTQMRMLLSVWMPEQNWDNIRFSAKNKRAKQRYLGLLLMELFENEVCFEDYIFKCSDKVYVFDFFIPARRLVIEYQGEQHYTNVLSHWLSLDEQKRRDEDKRRVCLEEGFTLIYVPYWWDASLESLKHLLHSSM